MMLIDDTRTYLFASEHAIFCWLLLAYRVIQTTDSLKTRMKIVAEIEMDTNIGRIGEEVWSMEALEKQKIKIKMNIT